MIPVTNEEKKITLQAKRMSYIQKGFSANDDNKKYQKIRGHCHYTGKYRGAGHNICNLRYETSKEIPVIFHNGSRYGYHFIIKELAN